MLRPGAWLGLHRRPFHFVGAGKLIGSPVHWAWLVGTPLLAGAAYGLAAGLWRRRPLLDAASEIDRRLRLKDRLSTATALAGIPLVGPDAFVQLALDDAETLSRSVDPTRATPLIWNAWWRAWPAACAAAIALGIWAPTMNLWQASHRARIEQAHARDALAKRLADAANLAKPEPPLSEPGKQRDKPAERNPVLEDIQRELAAEASSIPLKPRQAAAPRETRHVAAEREQKADALVRSHDEVQDAISRMDHSTTTGPESALTKALREGDLASAAAAAKDLLNAKPQQTPEERAKLASTL